MTRIYTTGNLSVSSNTDTNFLHQRHLYSGIPLAFRRKKLAEHLDSIRTQSETYYVKL